MKRIIVTKRIISIFIVFIFVFCLFGSLNIINATDDYNGIGTINDTYSRTIVEGATYTYVESDNGKPQKNYVLEYNPKVAEVDALAVYGSYAFGGDKLSANIALAESKGYTVIAGVNGSPFDTSNGLTIGTLISNGVIISASDSKSSYDSFAINEDGSMFISASNLSFSYNYNGSDIRVNYINKQKKSANDYIYLITSDYYTDTTTLANSTEVVLTVDSGSVSIGKKLECTVEQINENAKRTKVEEGKVVLVGPSLSALGNLQVGGKLTFDFTSNDTEYDWTKVKQSICGFYEILKDGNYVNTSSSEVHPRTTIGFKEDGTVVLFVVDGRQPNFSIGLTDLACAQYMKSLGCVGAIRMDGGGSSTMALRLPGDDHVTTINSPSDGGERSDADGLLLVLKSDYNQNVGENVLLHAYPKSIKILENTEVSINVKATDDRYNPIATPEYKIEVVDDCGEIIGNKFKAKEGSGTGKIKISSGAAITYVDVTITDEVDSIFANVNNLALSPNEKVSLSVKAYSNSNLITASNESFDWSCTAELGTIDDHGNFTATANAGVSGYIEITYGDVNCKVLVTVGQLPVEITGFEKDQAGTGSGQWRNNQVNGGTGGCSINDDLKYVKYGEKSLKIDFNLAGTTGTVGTQINNGSSVTIDGTPTAIGMWVYATPSAKGAWIRMQYSQSGSSNAYYADFGRIDWTGWKYLEADIEAGASYPISVKYLVRIMAVQESERVNGTIYVDQLRAVYGFTNDDFVSPEIKNLTPSDNGFTSESTQTVSFDVTDDLSGVNKEKTVFYLDDEKIDNIIFTDIQSGYSVSWTPSSIIPLTNGKHTIKVRVEDNYGNFLVKEWSFALVSDLPSISLSKINDFEVNKKGDLLINVSDSTISYYEIVLKYNPEEIEFDYDIEGLNGYNVKNYNIDDTNGIVVIKIENTSSDVSYNELNTVSLNLQCLKPGALSIDIDSVKFKVSEYGDIMFESEVDPFEVNCKYNYDFSLLISLVDMIDENNVIKSLSLLKEANIELLKIEREYITDIVVLEKLEKLDRCNQKYEQIISALGSVKDSSSIVGSLIGGK